VNLAGKRNYNYVEERTETRTAREQVLGDGLKEGQQYWGRKWTTRVSEEEVRSRGLDRTDKCVA
jgi:hypothetical protein